MAYLIKKTLVMFLALISILGLVDSKCESFRISHSPIQTQYSPLTFPLL